MVHQAFGYSFVLTCLYFSPYPLFAGDPILLCITLDQALQPVHAEEQHSSGF